MTLQKLEDRLLVLGMSGKLGVGKNYMSDTFIIPSLMSKFKKLDLQVIPFYFSFGSFIKADMYARDDTQDLDFHSLFVQKTSQVRQRLQTYGTEMGREKWRKDMWIRFVDIWKSIQLYQLDQLPSHVKSGIVPLLVIQDIRFDNELHYVQSFKNSLVVRVTAPERNLIRLKTENSNRNHISETELDNAHFEHEIDNDINTKEENVILNVDKMITDFMTKIDLKI